VTKLIEAITQLSPVIPGAKERIALVREEFLHACAALRYDSEKSTRSSCFGKNKLEITANSPEVGEAKENHGHQLQRPGYSHCVQSQVRH